MADDGFSLRTVRLHAQLGDGETARMACRLGMREGLPLLLLPLPVLCRGLDVPESGAWVSRCRYTLPEPRRQQDSLMLPIDGLLSKNLGRSATMDFGPVPDAGSVGPSPAAGDGAGFGDTPGEPALTPDSADLDDATDGDGFSVAPEPVRPGSPAAALMASRISNLDTRWASPRPRAAGRGRERRRSEPLMFWPGFCIGLLDLRCVG